ncbi:pyridoxamine 5'-phosphate oxidase family protein [Aestuariivita sp.]|uniref:HugZ family pyridoxamine 5'-phosphate oxidase n=1 Tax=Aestuariivita sp. TaxID=1872407 RepID=UPI0021705A38|nr:pyridoxamine 5'-phosphate oxidase family protein [Aestuariivita sp.]MCE8008413.1 pyridoxamine 5-phosphate oxidase [Aestuariivita sp.]
MPSPIRPTDDAARDLARRLMAQARFCALAVLDHDGAPLTSRIAFGQGPGGAPITLISDLSTHTRALLRDPRCSLLVGEPGTKGDPLTHPRLTLQGTARIVARDTPDHDGMQRNWLEKHPKSRLYIGFADFRFARFTISSGFLNGGFGKAFDLTAQDLGLA